MTREWVSTTDQRWVMACDQIGCRTRSEPFPEQPNLALFQARGWFVAQPWGDICPACLARGVRPTARPYRGVVPAPIAEEAQ